MDYSVYEMWVTKSFRWIREDKDSHIPHHVQMLGIIDAELRGIRNEDIFDPSGSPKEDADGILSLERQQIKAHLWVLGAYELVRMISQRLRESAELAESESIERVAETKKLFERVRIPMAKLEPSKRREKTDFEVAYAGMGPKGLGWKVSPDTVIYQEELSEKLYEMFSCMWPEKA